MGLIKLLLNGKMFHPPDSTEDEADDSFSPTISDEERDELTAYHGRNVTWYGDKGRVLQMNADDVYPVDGNIFYSNKLASIKKIINDHPDNVELLMGYGFPSMVDIQDISESIVYKHDTMSEPLTTEDDEIDLYLGGEYNDYWDDEYSIIKEFVDAKFLMIANGEETIEQNAKNFEEFMEHKVDADDHEEAMGEYEDWVSMEQEVKEVIDEEYGDIGRIIMQIRDGNHRVFGAIEAGEPYVFVHVEEGRMNRIEPEIKKQLI